MTRPVKVSLIAGFVAMIAAGALVAAFAKTENDFFQFCTTKAYGWPAPWKIDSCECEGSKTTYPMTSKLVNFSVIAGSGIAGFALAGGLFRLRNLHNKQKQSKQAHSTASSLLL
ncbi:MAG: hypothetical protein ACKO2G_12640 [Verrucomicrobiales bacterium]